jgi:diguanylate cyclase (GGDEF)-like protein/PAS domain S-box-containing protein
MNEWSSTLLRAALDAAPDGIVICDAKGADHPVVYVNPAFERLTGYGSDELVGHDLRRLQAWDREQDGRAPVREAVTRGGSHKALMRNYRKDGTQFWNEFNLEPVRAPDGTITHYISFHRDVSERERSGLRRVAGLPTWEREDRLSGLCSRAYFEELLQHDWTVGQREARMLTLMLFDIDELGIYNDTFGRAAGDACIRRVAGVIGASFRRGADVVARWDGGTLCALVRNPDVAAMPVFAAAIAQRVLGQHIHHPRAARQKFVSVSVGVASLNPATDRQADMLVHAAQKALKRAKLDRQGHVVMAGPEDL